jgi:hypothetical protein
MDLWCNLTAATEPQNPDTNENRRTSFDFGMFLPFPEQPKDQINCLCITIIISRNGHTAAPYVGPDHHPYA